jgi:endonuclease YncB( thermonuclease family)
MPNGLLEVSGKIDLTQFWNTGQSDADTVKVLLSGPNAFRFTPHQGAKAKVTHAFDNALVKGKVNKAPIDKQNRVVIRLQGIDAPELHYRPLAPTVNGQKPTAQQRAAFNAAAADFRQYYGETATVNLAAYLAKAGKSPIKCVVRTAVDDPSDVFDTYGRLVGDIYVTINGVEQDINSWLCKEGWAFPTFYSSMTNAEINALMALSNAAQQSKKGIWTDASSDLSAFNRTLVFRNKGALNAAKDKGKVYLPKLFRRRSTYGIAKIAAIVSGSLKSYLKANPDACFETTDFLTNGITSATPRRLDEFVTTQSQFLVGPPDLVFQEAKSRVVDSKGQPAKW